MAFVVERIPEEERKSLSSHINGYNPTLSSKWAIDRQRNAYMVIAKKIGGPYEGTDVTKYYALIWQEKNILITATPSKPSISEDGPTISWRVSALSIPSELRDKKEEIISIVNDAFVCIGEFFDGDRYVRVNVNFDISSAKN